MNLLGEQHTSRHRQPVRTWRVPHRPDQRPRPYDQRHDRYCTVLWASAGIKGDDPPLPWIIDTGRGHHRLLPLLNAHHVVISPDCDRVAPQALSDIDAKVVQPKVAMRSDRA